MEKHTLLRRVLLLFLIGAICIVSYGCGESEGLIDTEINDSGEDLNTERDITDMETNAKKTVVSEKITISEPEKNIFSDDVIAEYKFKTTAGVKISSFGGYIYPENDTAARTLGDKCVAEMKSSIIADFEKSKEYCERHPEDHVDMMVHVSTFTIIDGMIYMTYYANTSTGAEDPAYQESRFAFCPYDDPSNMTIVRLQKVGDSIGGKTVTGVYDIILLHKDDDELYLMWTASVDGMYYRFYCTYIISTATISAIRPNRFKVGDITNDFSTKGIILALAGNGIPVKSLWSDIGIMQKLTSREENGETWYYTGAYSGNFNCIIKSRDFITWEYVSTPDFDNLSKWENAVYVLEDKCYYFVRQDDICKEGFLTSYDLVNDTWGTPVLISDTQSRSDFIYHEDELYLIHAPIDRNGFGIVRIDRDNLANSEVVLVADMRDSLFYPYTLIYDDYLYMSYTVNRKHIRLSRFKLENYLS